MYCENKGSLAIILLYSHVRGNGKGLVLYLCESKKSQMTKREDVKAGTIAR